MNYNFLNTPNDNLNEIREINELDTITKQIEVMYKLNNLTFDLSTEDGFIFRAIKKQSCNLVINNKLYGAKEEDIIIINPNQCHSIYTDNPSKIDHDTMFLSKYFFNEFIISLIKKENYLIDNPHIKNNLPIEFKNNLIPSNLLLCQLLSKISNTKSNIIGGTLLKELYIQELLVLLINEELKDISNQKYDEKIPSFIKAELKIRLANVIEYMQDNYKDDICLNDLTTISCLSKAHFIRIFRSSFNCSPYEYLVKIRMDKAKEQIINTKHSITEISFDHGYTSLSSFIKAFKKYTGLSPTQYKSQYRK